MPRPTILLLILLISSSLVTRQSARAGESSARAQASLQSYTGIWNMPNARVLPDWHARLKFGVADPYSYYGGALGAFDRFEIHGQFTQTNTIIAFPGYNYGYTKDRAAGARMVLLKETGALPQISAGFFDATGNAHFGSRYLVASKMFGNVDFTLGAGQGVLAGEYVAGFPGGSNDSGFNFLLSDPLRPTKPFAGVEWHVTPDLTLSAEYSSMDFSQMFGFLNTDGGPPLKNDDTIMPVNMGVKYNVTPGFYLQAGMIGGATVFGGIGVDFDLSPGQLLGWRKRTAYRATERIRQQLATIDPEEASQRIADELYDDGFTKVIVSLGAESVWIETETTGYLSDARALARVGAILNEILPPRIETFYLAIRHRHQLLTSWQVKRADFSDYRESRINTDALLSFSSLDLYPDANHRNFLSTNEDIATASSNDAWYSFSVSPKIRTFLNNKSGFFKHKIVLKNTLGLEPWKGALFTNTLELPLYNQYSDLDYDPLEKEAARTDIKLYEERSTPHLAEMSFDQIFKLPKSVYARASAGMFEAAYAGFGGELFRYFNDGLWGAGLEMETVRKRDLDDDFKLSETDKTWRTPAYLNLYAQLWPEQGIEGGLKIGRFLAGDAGARIELRRTFKYCTLGAWLTKTDTSVFQSEKNIGVEEKGVYITIPLAFFSDRESRRRISYAITSFTRDQGQTVAQPRHLYPVNPFGTPAFVKQHLNDMRK